MNLCELPRAMRVEEMVPCVPVPPDDMVCFPGLPNCCREEVSGEMFSLKQPIHTNQSAITIQFTWPLKDSGKNNNELFVLDSIHHLICIPFGS